ncbi:MAG: hypothetical protein WA051_01895 [Minisyncoccia bacterium]
MAFILPLWIKADEVVGYIINAYAGIDESPNRPGRMRRVFLWEDGDEIKMGNAEAFVMHLGQKFGKKLKPADASAVHALLRELGESLTPHLRGHAKPSDTSSKIGRFKQPDPEEWVVRKK